MAGVQSAVEKAKAERQTPEQRLANGELLYRMNDYARAIVVLSEILEEFPNTPSYPDALWLRGETYYAAHDYLAARRDYRALVDRGNEPRFQAYFGKALARLVDVALRLERSARDARADLREVQPGAAGAGRRGAALREGQGLLPPGLVQRRARGVLAGRQGHAVHAPGAVLPGPRRA